MKNWKEFELMSTEDFIDTFQKKGVDESDKKNAFFSLVHRFRKDLLEKCEIICKRFGHSPNVAEIIAENTFKAYAIKGNFKYNKSSRSNTNEAFQIYLYKISRNELTNFYRQEEKKAKGLLYDGAEKIVTNLPEVDFDRPDTKSRIIYNIIQALPTSQRTVYLTYMAHERIGCNIPKNLMEDLRHHLGDVKQSTIRSYKKQAHDKIKEGLNIMNLTLNSKL